MRPRRVPVPGAVVLKGQLRASLPHGPAPGPPLGCSRAGGGAARGGRRSPPSRTRGRELRTVKSSIGCLGLGCHRWDPTDLGNPLRVFFWPHRPKGNSLQGASCSLPEPHALTPHPSLSGMEHEPRGSLLPFLLSFPSPSRTGPAGRRAPRGASEEGIGTWVSLQHTPSLSPNR